MATAKANRRSAPAAARIKNKNELQPSAVAPIDPLTPRRWALALLLIIGAFVLYLPALSHPFVNYDDPDYVTQNLHVQQGLTFDTFTWALSSTEFSNWHPVTWLSHALDCEILGVNAAWHHFTNILLHALNAALLFLLLASVTGKTARSLFVAALFAVHPLNVESVAWIAERKTVLSMFFLLLTLAAYAWYARQPGIRRFVCVVLLFVLGLAAKPMVVTLPFVMLLLDYWPLQRFKGWTSYSTAFPVPQKSGPSLILEKLPLLAFSAASCAITLVAQRGSMLPSEFLPFGLRLANAIRAYAMYLSKMFWPNPLAVYYPRGNGVAAWEIALSVLVLCAISALAWKTRAHGYSLIGWLWFLGTLVPMIGLVQVGNQAMADRYAYLPLIGIFIAIAWGIGDLAGVVNLTPNFRIAAGSVVVVALSWVAARQLRVWDSSLVLWTHALAVTKDNYVANDNLAYELLTQGRSQEALDQFEEAARIAPNDTLSHWALAASFEDRGRLQEAAQNYEVVIRNTANQRQLAAACLSTAVISTELGDYNTAAEYAHRALSTDPRVVDAIVLDAQTTAQRNPSSGAFVRVGLLLEQVQQIARAEQAYQQAIQLDPNSPLAHRLLNHLHAAASGS
jgi:tetratricopeptide (TPR) repeat protein